MDHSGVRQYEKKPNYWNFDPTGCDTINIRMCMSKCILGQHYELQVSAIARNPTPAYLLVICDDRLDI